MCRQGSLDLKSRDLDYKIIGNPKVTSAFHPSEVNQMSIGNSWDLEVKGKLSPQKKIKKGYKVK